MATSPLPETKYKSQPADPFSLQPHYPVIPAKAGIQMVVASQAIRNQVQISASGSPLPLWERARVRVSRALARVLTPANLPLQALHRRGLWRGRAARKRGSAGGTPALQLAPPSFPRKMESRWLQPSPLPETKYKSQPADPISLQPPPRHSRERWNPDGYSQARYPKSSTNPNQRIPSPLQPPPRHSRESGNPEGCSQARYPKPSTNPSQRIPSPFMGEG